MKNTYISNVLICMIFLFSSSINNVDICALLSHNCPCLQSISGYNSPVMSPHYDPSSQESLSSHHHLQLYKQRLEQQIQHTQIAQAHVQMLQQQLTAETQARTAAQVDNGWGDKLRWGRWGRGSGEKLK